MMRFERKGKLAPRYIDLYEIVEHVGKVAYILVFPKSMTHIHDVFHVSSLHKYIGNPSYILKTKEIQLLEILSYDDRSVRILDMRTTQLRNQQIPTWQIKQTIKDKHPKLFPMNFRVRIPIKGRNCATHMYISKEK